MASEKMLVIREITERLNTTMRSIRNEQKLKEELLKSLSEKLSELFLNDGIKTNVTMGYDTILLDFIEPVKPQETI